jgi:hypothetical protein
MPGAHALRNEHAWQEVNEKGLGEIKWVIIFYWQ